MGIPVVLAGQFCEMNTAAVSSILERFEVVSEHRLPTPVLYGNSCALFRFKRCSDAGKTQRVHA